MDFEKLPVGTKAFIFAKNYYSVLSKRLESLEIERYYSVLTYINSNKGCTQQQICDRLMIDKASMVKVIDYLVKAKYVSRAVNPENRREYNLLLTPLGQKRADTVQKEFDALDKLILNEMNEQERTVFVHSMGKVANFLKNLPSNSLFFNYKKSK